MSKTTEIINQIQTGNFSMEELKEISFAIKCEFNSKQDIARSEFKIGDKVKFTAKNMIQYGTVVKVLQKNIKVHVKHSNLMWRVSPNLLSKA